MELNIKIKYISGGEERAMLMQRQEYVEKHLSRKL